MITTKTAKLLPALALALAACPGTLEESPDDEALDDATSLDESATLDGPGDADESEPKLDQPAEMDLPEGPTMGCEKIDFLFVIDSSGSMADNQANLIASFPGLVEAMMQNVPADDWHVMVVDTDGQWGGSDCANACMALDTCPGVPEFPCDTPPPSFCDIRLGAGQVAPWGEAASNQECGLAGGQRYVQQAEPDLLSAFSCVAKVGVDGSDFERPMDAMVGALAPEAIAAGGCNQGFVRDDAILVVTIITDEPDAHSIGDPSAWADALIEAKLGNPAAIVVLGILPDGDLQSPVCIEASPSAGAMSEFLELFDASSRGSVCEPDYSPFFVDAVALIGETCDEFVPIG
ncbi:hypothetical protein ACNOYE_22390 [Nannocystaceae bacterium ST9]